MLRKRIKILIILSLLTIIWGLFLYMHIHGISILKSNTNFEAKTEAVILDVPQPLSIPTITLEPEPVPEPVREMCGEFYCYSSQDFVDIYNEFETMSEDPKLPKYIYNNKTVDDYLKNIAESLGYQKRIFADENELVYFENVITRVEVRDAYKKMRDEMKEQGILLHFVSGYRNSISQRSIFKRKASIDGIENIPTGLYDPAIYKTLAVSALPGYSKHHSGYAVDFGCGNDYLVYQFAETNCYEWMSANNFENTKRFGFIPSYPEGVENQGPNPEPWEFVWIGVENLK